MTLWTKITIWIGLILIVDALFALIFRRSLNQMIPGIDIKVVAVTELVTGLAILGFNLAVLSVF
tara:strand:+ start:355 stop:546 length:192 start_codon:yes stop_codon:yes gene_type:complete